MPDLRQAEVPLTATEIDGLCAILARTAGVVAAISGSGVAIIEGVDATLMEACAYVRGRQAASEGADTPRVPAGAQAAG